MSERPLPELRQILRVLKNAREDHEAGRITTDQLLDEHEKVVPGFREVSFLSRLRGNEGKGAER